MNTADARHRILLAEDRRAGPAIAAPILAQAGYPVDEAQDGPGAVEAAGTHRYALVLLDLELPGLNGLEATRRIRRLPHPCGDVPILAIAATCRLEDKDRCFAAGMDGFLGKPIEREQLLETVGHWLESGEDPTWGLEPRPGMKPPLLNRCTLIQLEEDVGLELLPDILTTFLVEAERRVGLLAARVAADDPAGAAAEAHALKGSAGTFGAMALRQAAYEMEQAGRAGDRERVGRLLEPIERLAGETCDRLRVEFPFLAS